VNNPEVKEGEKSKPHFELKWRACRHIRAGFCARRSCFRKTAWHFLRPLVPFLLILL
jgi:hypothetical protein